MRRRSRFNSIVVVSAICLIILLIAADYFCITGTGNHLRQQTEDMLKLTQTEEWRDVERLFTEMKEYWQANRVYWLLFVPRSSVDTIEMEHARLKQYISTQEKENTLQSLGAIMEELEQVVGLVEFNWQNML